MKTANDKHMLNEKLEVKKKEHIIEEKNCWLYFCAWHLVDSSRLELRKGKAKGEDGGPLSEVDTTRAKGKTRPCTRVKETCIEK